MMQNSPTGGYLTFKFFMHAKSRKVDSFYSYLVGAGTYQESFASSCDPIKYNGQYLLQTFCFLISKMES